MSVIRSSTKVYSVVWLVMFASLTVWSNLVFAGCSDVVPNGLVACYPFDGNANDASGNGNHGIDKGQLDYVDSPLGKAALFDGKNDYVEVPNNPSLELNRHLTISYLIAPRLPITCISPNVPRFCASYGGLMFVLTKGRHEGNNYASLLVQVTNGSIIGTVVFQQYPLTTASTFTYGTGVAIVPDQFVRVTIIREDTQLKFYLGSELKAEYTISYDANEKHEPLFIGSDGGYGYNLLSGKLDELRIYNRALTEAEVKQLFYNEANPESVICAPANYTNGVLQVPFITISGVTDTYKATLQQYSSSFGFQVTQSAIVTGKKSSCPATYSTKTGIGVLHIPLVKTKTTLPPNTPQCYDVTLQEFSNRFQLDLEQVKLTPCP